MGRESPKRVWRIIWMALKALFTRDISAHNISTPIAFGYRPELDTTPLLNPDQANYYQSLIGVLRWAIELGRIDILIHVSMLSSFLAAPRQGHLSQVHHIFAYLKKYPRSTMVFDDTTPIVDPSTFFQADWTEFYRDAKELIPPNAPTPRGKPVEMYCFCDADHAGDKITRRSHSGILLFLNRAHKILLKHQRSERNLWH